MNKSDQRARFLELLAHHEAQLLGFLCAILPRYQDAEDVFQQTVLTMWQKFHTFEEGTNFIAWGCGIGRNKAMNFLRSQRVTFLDDEIIDMLATRQCEESPEDRLERRRALSCCIKKLSEKDQFLIQSAYSGEHSIKELATQLGRSPAGVYNSLSRIRSALYRCIKTTVSQQGLS